MYSILPKKVALVYAPAGVSGRKRKGWERGGPQPSRRVDTLGQPYAAATGSSTSVASGGRVRHTLAGRPWQATSSAVTMPLLPTPLPP